MDGTVGVFDVATATLMHTLKGMFKPVRCLAWLPDSWTLACGCDDGMVHLYDGEHGQLIDELTGHAPGWVLSASAAPSGATLATGGSEATVRLWDVATRTCAQTLKGEHSDLVWACAFSPDGARLATGADDKAIALYAVS
jgi:WD repeat-containing protein 61